jgi:hypothetical protein
MTDPLDSVIRKIQSRLEESFIYRKLGLCFDYAAPPGQFPPQTLPNPKEARNMQPNPDGEGTGIFESAHNGALLFDGYLLRLELGIAAPEEETVFDRLIGGLIRTATIAPRNFLVRGLTADGRGFYGRVDPDSHLLWAYSAWRGFRTGAMASESQVKIQNIVAKWIGRIQQQEYVLTPLSGETLPAGNLLALDWHTGPKLLALLAVAANITGDAAIKSIFIEKADENSSARVGFAVPGGVENPFELMSLQIAFFLLLQFDENEDRKSVIRKRMREVSAQAARFLSAYRELDPEILADAPDLDWRKLSNSSPELAPAWRRFPHERKTVVASLQAALAILLEGDKDAAEPHAEIIADCLQTVPFDKLWLASALAPALSVHALGFELGLWDQELGNRIYAIDGTSSLVADYMAEDFDERRPELAGHTVSPKKAAPPPPEPGKRNGNARPAQATAAAPAEDGERNNNRRRGGRRRRRKK